MPSLQALNYGAGFLHFVQAIIVASLIAGLNSKHEAEPPLKNGIYRVQKNLYVIREVNDSHPKCDLPVLRNVSSAPGMALSLPDAGLRVDTSDYYMFDNPGFIDAHLGLKQSFAVGYLDNRYVIFAFFLLSAVFQLAEALAGNYQGPRVMRFVEYSISSSLMIMAIAVQVGLTDVYILVAMFTLMFATNMLGLLAEVLCYLGEHGAVPIWLWAVPHLVGWVTCLVAYAPILDAYLSSTRCSDKQPPGFVNVIVFLEFSLFNSFGFVQVYSLVRKTMRFNATEGGYGPRYQGVASSGSGSELLEPSQDITDRADLLYVSLSLTAKTLLAWLILAPTLA